MRMQFALMTLAGCLAFSHQIRAKAVDLHDFTGRGADGATPNGPVTVDRHGTLFGTTFNGGDGGPPCNGGCGTVFETRPPAPGKAAWKTTTLYSFTDGADGGLPSSPLLVDGAGHVYSSTNLASGAPGGNVFRLTPPAVKGGAWQFDNLYLFQGQQDGSLAYGGTPLVASGDSLLGVTQTGGTSTRCKNGCGTVFRLTPPPGGTGLWTYQLVYSFTGGADSVPAGIAGPDSNGVFYAWTWGGDGEVAALTPANGGGATETVLYTFTGGKDGSTPVAIVLGRRGVFGAAAGGGASHKGEIFELKPGAQGGAWRKNDLYDFAGFESTPNSLAIGKGGVLAGVSFGEIDLSPGRVWTVAPPSAPGAAWKYTALSIRGLQSSNPENVVFGLDGYLYGVMNGGDTGSLGLVFETH